MRCIFTWEGLNSAEKKALMPSIQTSAESGWNWVQRDEGIEGEGKISGAGKKKGGKRQTRGAGVGRDRRDSGCEREITG